MKVRLRQKAALIIFGIFIFLALLEMGLRIGAFGLAYLQESGNIQAIKRKGAFRIMCIGESTTIVGGLSVYTRQLENILNQKNMPVKFSVINKGVGGTNTSRIADTLEDNINKYKPDMVVAMIGINDFGYHMPLEEPAPKKQPSFLQSLRLYKLTRLIWLHLVTRIKETGLYAPNKYDSARRTNSREEAGSIIAGNYSDDKYAMILKSDFKVYVDSAKSHKTFGNYLMAIDSYRKAITLNPGNDNIYAELGDVYRTIGEFDKAEQLFKKAIELNPKNDAAYTGLGWLYSQQEQYLKAEEYATKAAVLNPNNDKAYIILGIIHRFKKEFDKAEEFFNKSIKLNSGDDLARLELGAMYEVLLNDYKKAEETFEGINPANQVKYEKLAWIYIAEGKSAKIEELIGKISELGFNNEYIYGILAVLYKELGRPGLSDEYYKKLHEIRLKSQNIVTRNNYLKIKKILDKHGIKLVCVQYPVRSIEPLKKMLGGQEGCLFVDNERIFKDVLKDSSYKKYFIDLFAGDFGHCTAEGNRLLAENIAYTIMKEYFKISVGINSKSHYFE